MPSCVEKNKEVPTKEVLRDVLRFCDPLEKAIVLVQSSAGLTAEETINLKVHDFKAGYDSQTEITTLSLFRKTTRIKYTTFLTPEASRAIMNYLEYRDRHKTQKVISDNGYLFIRRQILAEFIETGNEELRKMKVDNLARIHRRISEKSIEDAPKISSHSLRKFFCTTLINAGAGSDFVNFSIGHVIENTSLAYFQATVDKHMYARYVPFLTIDDKLDVSKEKVAMQELL